MTIECLTPATRAEWLEFRRHDVTASQIGAVVNVHPDLTPFELWTDKTSPLDDSGETPAMRRGRLLEPIALDLVREHYAPANVLSNAGPRFYYRDREARIGATPDCLVSDPARGLGVVEIKTTDEWTFNSTWRSDGAIEPPLHVGLQALTQAMLMPQATWAAVAVLRSGHGIEIDFVEVPLHAGAWERIKAAVADFWRLVDAGTPPPPDYNRDGRLIASLYPVDAGTEIDLSGDNEFVAAVAERCSLKNQEREISAGLDRVEAEIRHKIGSAQRAIAGDWLVTARTEHVKEYTVAARTRRPLRIRVRSGAAA